MNRDIFNQTSLLSLSEIRLDGKPTHLPIYWSWLFTGMGHHLPPLWATCSSVSKSVLYLVWICFISHPSRAPGTSISEHAFSTALVLTRLGKSLPHLQENLSLTLLMVSAGLWWWPACTYRPKFLFFIEKAVKTNNVHILDDKQYECSGLQHSPWPHN